MRRLGITPLLTLAVPTHAGGQTRERLCNALASGPAQQQTQDGQP